MRVVITNGLAIYRSPEDTGLFIQWNVENPPSAEIRFKIERAQAPDGPYELVADNIQSYFYYDNNREPRGAAPDEAYENVNLLSILRSIFYRITATAANGDTAFAVSDATNDLPRRLRLLHRKMQRDLSVGLKFNGVPAYILKRLHWGVRCKSCFDLLTKKVTNSKCASCYGTGFQNGYATPVEIKIRFLAPNSEVQMAPQGWTDTTRIRIICLPYPRLFPSDVIVDKLSNARYIVQQNSQTELRREPVHQSVSLSELSHDSIEYRIPINKDHIPVMY